MSNRNKTKLTFRERLRKQLENLNIIKPKKIETEVKLNKTKENKPVKKKRKSFVKRVQETFENIGKTFTVKKPKVKKVKLRDGDIANPEQLARIKNKIENINLQYENRKQNIADSSEKLFGKEISRAIKRDLEESTNKSRTRLTSGAFDDLVELDFEKFISKASNEEELTRLEQGLMENEFYDLDLRDKRYKENYIKSLRTVFGDNSDVDKLVDIIEQMDDDLFMLSYYNPYSNTQIKDHYDALQSEDYFEYLVSYFERLSNQSL